MIGRSENESRAAAGRSSARATPRPATNHMPRIAAVSGLTGLLLLAAAVASCAETDGAVAPESPPTVVPEAGTPEVKVDASADADCSDADEEGCTTHELTCAEADFCAVTTGIDARYALLGVWGSSATDVWAVGSGGTVIHWDGNAWTNVPSGRKDTMRAIGGRSASDVFIVSSMNVVLHTTGIQNGTATFTVEAPVNRDNPTNFMGATLTKVWSAPTGELFVGGPAILTSPQNSMWRHHPGVSPGDGPEYPWEAASTFCKGGTCIGVNGIWGTSASDVWIVGDYGAFLRSKASPGGGGGAEQWSTLKTTLTNEHLRAIWGSSASDVWSVGDEGTIRHWSNDGSGHWEIVPSPTKENLRAVWGTSPNDAWAVGDAGTILHWDGKTWMPATATLPLGPKPRLYGVWGSGPNDVWVVGEATALHFTGAKAPKIESNQR